MVTRTNEPERLAVIASVAGKAILKAFDDVPKRAGIAMGKTGHTGRAWARGDPSNPVFRTAALIKKSPNPMAIIAALLPHAIVEVPQMCDHTLGLEWIKAHETEIRYEAAGDIVEGEWPRTGDLRAIHDADMLEVSASLWRLALDVECLARKVDPRTALPKGGAS